MDETGQVVLQPNAEGSSVPKKKSRKKIFYITAIILFILIIFALAVYAFSQKSVTAPKTITKTPEATSSAEISNQLSEVELTPVFCPTTIDLCKKEDLVNKGSLEIKSKEKLPVYASFDGDLEVFLYDINPKDPFYLVLLTNPQKTKQAVYYFKGEAEKGKKQVKEGAVIATTNGIPTSMHNNSTLAFELKKLNGSAEQVILNSNSFK